MPIVITGADGFIGKNLRLRLAESGHAGVVALDPRHKTHNIPGKFLSYMQSGLPVLASINPGNDLAELIQSEGVGRVYTDHSVDTLQRLAQELTDEIAAAGAGFDNFSSSQPEALARVQRISGTGVGYSVQAMCADAWRWQSGNPDGYGASQRPR